MHFASKLTMIATTKKHVSCISFEFEISDSQSQLVPEHMSSRVIKVELCRKDALNRMQCIEVLRIEDSNCVKVRFSDDIHQWPLRNVQNGGHRGGSFHTVGEVKFGGGRSERVSKDFRGGPALRNNSCELVVRVEAGSSIYESLHHFFNKRCKTCFVAILVDDVEALAWLCVIVAPHGDSKVLSDEGMKCGRVQGPLW